MREAADRLESALGHEVRVRAAKGEEIAVEIRFETSTRPTSWPAASGAAAAPDAAPAWVSPARRYHRDLAGD